jgi:hypothetical protein
MTKDEALDLALEALEETLKTLDDANAIPGGPIADTIWYSPYETLFDYLEVKIAAIKQARSAPVQEPVAFFDPQGKGFYWAKPTKITAPVTVDFEPLPLYTTPPAAPVQERNFCERCGKRLGDYIHTCTPPATKEKNT